MGIGYRDRRIAGPAARLGRLVLRAEPHHPLRLRRKGGQERSFAVVMWFSPVPFASENIAKTPHFTRISADMRERFSVVQTRWRRERDLNPRYPFRYSGFQDRLFQPLTHPSAQNILFFSLLYDRFVFLPSPCVVPLSHRLPWSSRHHRPPYRGGHRASSADAFAMPPKQVYSLRCPPTKQRQEAGC